MSGREQCGLNRRLSTWRVQGGSCLSGGEGGGGEVSWRVVRVASCLSRRALEQKPNALGFGCSAVLPSRLIVFVCARRNRIGRYCLVFRLNRFPNFVINGRLRTAASVIPQFWTEIAETLR